MKYKELCEEKVSSLGLGAMRLPLLPDKSVDQELVNKMVDYAIENGMNYFDTAYSYLDNLSEIAIGKALNRYPRESYKLASKFPGHEFKDSYDVKGIFEEQLRKCQVDYFDFYLVHNLCERSIDTYKDERWKIPEFIREQKKAGRIKHIGVSTHARAENLEEMLDFLGDMVEFVLIQMNYLDWTLQKGKEKLEILKKRNLPVIIMEPLRGGKLAHLSDDLEEELLLKRPNESIASWSFRFLQKFDNIKVVLSGMSNLEQLEDNIKTFSEGEPLSDEETELLLSVADRMKVSVPCTACRYCVSKCPMELDIPMLLEGYNDMAFATNLQVSMQMDALPSNKRPESCIGCGSCTKVCPQEINIPNIMKDFSDKLAAGPNWDEICKHRDEVAKRMNKSYE